ncbi:integral membrane protein/CrcB-like protein [Halodesulfurarchaeum formicicum]|uniref:Fluoride-specific ion channel FluC n=1 Tax=Halodesulfurarchaeum formicicum TaxID=1873524 RepID=A0A1D8S389_9EURY|nr:fluoride efflux transporter CrcB [Halodesulfurarchaeum formicicum]AOW79832.1 integral membrane protein/CrcB-like protein [Halodesulfurarchaeum formicicum]APE95124.1 integral membrane protein/CrcB-like protein [Halodesulfurarchaeum formicicum]
MIDQLLQELGGTAEPYLVGFGGMIGASLRHVVSTWVEREEFPLGTLTVNILGSFLLGLLTFAGVTDSTMLLFGVGLCGSFTTFSSFSVDTVQLWEAGDRFVATGYALGNFLGAVAAIGAAWLLVTGLGGML